MKRVAFVLVALLALVAGVLSAGEFSHPSVIELSSKNFDASVSDGNVWFIKFYAPWCGHCKRLAPTWGELADATKSIPDVGSKIRVAHLDCTKNREVCTTYEIRGYPTLKVFHGGEGQEAYRQARSFDALKKYITGKAKDLLTETTA
ncbi:unnamed protein product [Pedinophyceae sp. YPF-701]|nr:unnamed protein product [Pedinophyceae sp. YPF-701]